MEHFRGRLTRSGNVIVESVEGRLTVDVGPNGAARWTGYFNLPPGATVELNEPFELALQDGRTSKIRIERLNQTAAGSTASFTYAS